MMGAQANAVYRIALPNQASVKERRNFNRSIETIRRANPRWAVVNDWAQQGEDKAFIILPKDKNYAYRRAAYQVEQSLARTFVRGYGR